MSRAGNRLPARMATTLQGRGRENNVGPDSADRSARSARDPKSAVVFLPFPHVTAGARHMALGRCRRAGRRTARTGVGGRNALFLPRRRRHYCAPGHVKTHSGETVVDSAVHARDGDINYCSVVAGVLWDACNGYSKGFGCRDGGGGTTEVGCFCRPRTALTTRTTRVRVGGAHTRVDSPRHET